MISLVNIISARATVQLACVISDRVPPGQLFTTFHFPDNNLNTLLSSSADAMSSCPEYKVLTVRLEKIPAKPRRNGKLNEKYRVATPEDAVRARGLV